MKKRIISSLLVLLLVVSTLLTNNNAQAAVKLNKSKATIYVGKTLQLKLTGTTKKATWSTSNKSVATVTSKGKVTGKSEGIAKITAKVGNKKYKCTVTVKSAFNSKEATKNVTFERHDTGKGIIVIATNKNKYPVAIGETIVYYDGGTMIDSAQNDIYCLAPNSSFAYSFYGPMDEDYNIVEYSSYKSNVKISKPVFNDKAPYIKTNADFGSGQVVVEVSNTGKYADGILVSIVFYKDGQVISQTESYADCNDPNTTGYVNFDFPYDFETYESIIPDDYEIYVQAFTYFN